MKRDWVARRPFDGVPSRWACIMAGGLGRRFWPLSRRTRPKHLIPVVGADTLLRQTGQRLADVVGWDHLMVVTNGEQASAVRTELPELPTGHVLAEPVGRNTAACVGLALRWLQLRREEGGTVGFFPSDHVVEDLDGFRLCLDRAWALAESGRVVAFGIVPTSPETGYGYMRVGAALHDAAQPRAFEVKSFHEKPDLAHARQWAVSGEHFWNSGMFVAKVDVLWAELARLLPATAEVLRRLGSELGDDDLAAHREVYSGLADVSVDHGIMEHSHLMAMVESTFRWDDVGSWEAASRYWPLSAGDNRLLGGDVTLVDCSGCRVRSEDLLVALVGMQDVIVVQSGDAILVCPRDRAQDVKALVENLETGARKRYL
ncbi:mannose-1-phosphate guanylyltransferase [Candidatus Fermentibacteria bacterium]|nr:mannose-1-phosphate guanylyltransferase [Candidatus Fermentibacteria bacterium]